jgi:hypothetical protein
MFYCRAAQKVRLDRIRAAKHDGKHIVFNLYCYRRCSASAGWRPLLEACSAEKSCSGARIQ